MAQIRNFGFMPNVKESGVSAPSGYDAYSGKVFLGFVGYTDRKFTDRFVGCDELGEPGITRITAFFPRSFYPSYIGRCRRADERSFA